ncbi:MAG: Ig-like domain-containing protein, partial [Treponema sp.]|nr:Ig-like domain-containing protein [Treponema sp.]
MIRRSPTAILIILMVIGVLMIPSCNNMLMPRHAGAVSAGNVYVTFSAGRSALSPAESVFDVYEFIFYQNGEAVGPSQARERNNASNEAFVFSLPSGDYTLEVKAYVNSVAAENLAASGTSASFSVGSAPVRVPVQLTANAAEGSGSFSFAIQIPENGEIKELSLYDSNNESPDLLGTAIIENGIISGTVAVGAGWHFVILRMGKTINGDQAEAGYANGVFICANNTTFFGTIDAPFAFSDDEFGVPPMTSDPERVYFWHGFDVPGSGMYYNTNLYKSGNAIGSHYDTYVDDEGVHEDVLELTPPSAAGYQKQTMIMTRPVTEAGTYTLSMDYKVVKGNEDVVLFWYNTGGALGDAQPAPNECWRVIAGSQSEMEADDYGTWLHMTGTFDLNANEEIGMIAWNDAGLYGLKDAVIYINNLELTDINGQPVPEPEYNYNYDMAIYPQTVTLIPGGSLTFEANYSFNWTGYDSGIISVDSNGTVTANAAGTTTITAVLKNDPTKTVQIPVKVIAKPTGTKYIA